MKRLLELAALALGIAVPLWYRQWQVERQLASEMRRAAKQWNGWGESLVREIKRAWRDA